MTRGKSRIIVWRDALRDSELDSTAKLVGQVLSTWMNGSGYCYPSRERIAEGCSLSVRAIDGALRRLEEADFLDIEWSAGGRRKTHTFLSTLPETANELRRSEWRNLAADDVNLAADDVNGAAPAPESALKRLKASSATAAGAAEPLPEKSRRRRKGRADPNRDIYPTHPPGVQV